MVCSQTIVPLFASASEMIFGMLFGFVLMSFVSAAVALPFIAVVRWSGYWRIAALLPAGAVIFAVARILIDTRNDPTSHNLWPFELALWIMGAVAVIGVLWIARVMVLGYRADAQLRSSE